MSEINVNIIDQIVNVEASSGPGPTGPAGPGIAIGGTTGQVLAKNSSTNYDTIWTSPSTGTVTSVNMSVPTGLTISGNPITSSGTLALALASGYSIPTTSSQSFWSTAYNDSIVSASVTGTTAKTLTLNQQDGGTIIASWTDINTDAVSSVFGRTGIVVATSGDYTTTLITEGTNLYYLDSRARAALSAGTGISYNNTTGTISSTITQYTDALSRAAISLTTTGTSGAATYNSTTGVLNVPQYIGGVTSVYGRTGAVVAQSGDYTTTQVTEGTNLYYTDVRSRSSLSFAAGSGAYNSITGVINIPTNNTQLTNGSNYITLASLSGTTPLTYNSGTGAISITQSGATTNGYLSSADWTTFNNKQGAITLTTTGTSGASTFIGSTLNIPQYSGTNIYTADDTLTGNRTVTMGSYTLSFEKDVLINGLTIGKGNGSLSNNIAIGLNALLNASIGINNTAIGTDTLKNNTGGSNVAVGYQALITNLGGNSNTAIGGFETLSSNTTGSNNVAIGRGSLKSNTTTSNSVVIGNQSAYLNTGGDNISIGTSSMSNNLTGSFNTVIGINALQASGSASQNTAIGRQSLQFATGNDNTAIGLNAAFSQTSATNNIAIGNSSLAYNLIGSNNIAIGRSAGLSLTSGNLTNASNSIFIGTSTKSNIDSQTNQIVIGYNSTGLGSNTTVIGNSSTTDVAIYGRMLVNYSAPVIGTYALDVNGTGRFISDVTINGVLQETITTNRQTSSYTLALSDRGKLVEMNVATANTLTIPLNSSIAFPIGTKIDVTQYGAGQVTITATGGVTLRSFTSYIKLAGQYAACTLVKIGTDEWYAYGNFCLLYTSDAADE